MIKTNSAGLTQTTSRFKLTTVSIFSLRYLGLLPVLNYNCTSMTVSFTTFTRQFHPRLLQNQRLSHIQVHHGSTFHLTRASRRCLARGHDSWTPRASAMLGTETWERRLLIRHMRANRYKGDEDSLSGGNIRDDGDNQSSTRTRNRRRKIWSGWRWLRTINNGCIMILRVSHYREALDACRGIGEAI
jgi:hypothetical protein